MSSATPTGINRRVYGRGVIVKRLDGVSSKLPPARVLQLVELIYDDDRYRVSAALLSTFAASARASAALRLYSSASLRISLSKLIGQYGSVEAAPRLPLEALAWPGEDRHMRPRMRFICSIS